MTKITKLECINNSKKELEEILIKNLPAEINGGNKKENANCFKHKTKVALNKCDFIHYNSKEQISFIIFDFDKVGEKLAIEVYPSINLFMDHLLKTIDIEPTFVTQTQKGYHFAFHLKNHVFTKQKKVINYLTRIKESIIKKLECDIHGSTRNYGIWRNPLRHNFYYSQCFNYELKDFNHIILPKKSIQRQFNLDVADRQIKRKAISVGNRNNSLFMLGLEFAKGKKNIAQEYIESYLLFVNATLKKSLEEEEVKKISLSIYTRYYLTNKIYISTFKETRDINFGIMNFPKMKGVTVEEFKIELKRRQSLSAKRTNEIIKDKKANFKKAREVYKKKIIATNLQIVKNAIKELENKNEKVTISALSRITELDRKTVRKYKNFPKIESIV